ncbi:DUF5597 domain-containing protein [Mucilaginibacter sp. ZT4R22]|uniref:DUF5597 domain-containing protein n=1 Tax=Mucilaginibacter pankratovii TaxID=2772110 RepID=A0ABR7WTH6_9SPHI|nr:DUF5597 domain-containing protein [Mucilaginibacter pankratovii]MBD1365621.1 DUF5597 domain-containing protein [Mucilaginibacter pankratovii]
MKKNISLWFVLLLLAANNALGQQITYLMPRVIEKNGHHALLVDGKPFLMLGGQAHNSSAWPGMLPQVWHAVETMHANTLEVPIYWEQIEATQGKFDFSVVDTLLAQARTHKTRLVLLWFATWKNGSNHYMPGWMKNNAAKYPNITGKSGKPIDSPSPNVEATLEADTKAFAAVMRYLKKADPQHTVIMVQVENEPGAWDTIRDYSPLAQKLFDGPVPAELLKPEVLKALNRPADAEGTWQKVFGERADEYFHAWSVARFIGKVAAAGKAEYALPLYVNAALRDPLTNPMANSYESGGPTDNVIPIYKAAAPSIDVLSPDIYLDGSERILKVIELYDRPDNALFVPEASLAPHMARYMYDVIARGGIGFSPFGIDSNRPDGKKAETIERLASFAQDYKVFSPMMRELAQWGFDGKIKAVVEREDNAPQTIDLGAWQAMVSFGSSWRGNDVTKNEKPTGRAMVIKLAENEFVVIGALCHITFKPLGNNQGRVWQYLKVEEGQYEKGKFKSLRILNGDETDWGGPRLGATPVVLKISLGVR